MAFTGAPLAAALAVVTTHPAAALGMGGYLGTLRTGAWADMVLLREEGGGKGVTVAQTWVGGVLGWAEGRAE